MLESYDIESTFFWCSKFKTAGMPHPTHGDVQSRPGQTNPTGQMSPNKSYAKPNQLAECWLCCMGTCTVLSQYGCQHLTMWWSNVPKPSPLQTATSLNSTHFNTQITFAVKSEPCHLNTIESTVIITRIQLDHADTACTMLTWELLMIILCKNYKGDTCVWGS